MEIIDLLFRALNAVVGVFRVNFWNIRVLNGHLLGVKILCKPHPTHISLWCDNRVANKSTTGVSLRWE